MMVRGISCEPSVDVFVSTDDERHIVEISWWPKDDGMAGKAGPLVVWWQDFHWDETRAILDGLTKAMAKVEARAKEQP